MISRCLFPFNVVFLFFFRWILYKKCYPCVAYNPSDDAAGWWSFNNRESFLKIELRWRKRKISLQISLRLMKEILIKKIEKNVREIADKMYFTRPFKKRFSTTFVDVPNHCSSRKRMTDKLAIQSVAQPQRS